MKSVLYEANTILFSQNSSKLGKMNARLRKEIWSKDKVTLDGFRNFADISSCFTFKKSRKETKLSNIFKTTNVAKLAKAILESSYGVLQGTSK